MHHQFFIVSKNRFNLIYLYSSAFLLHNMEKAGKTYTTFNKVRLSLFIRSYAHYYITQYVRVKHKINDKLTPRELRAKYYDKHAIPEISRLCRVLNLNYASLWKSILLEKKYALNKKIKGKDNIGIFLSVEQEIIALSIAKQNKSDFKDPDYESELAVLSIAIERAVGNDLKDIEDDFDFAQRLEELKKKYNYWYYKVAYKYKLPTLRITPFVVRLITSK